MMINDILIDHNLRRNGEKKKKLQYSGRKRKGKTNSCREKIYPSLTKVQAIPKQKARVAFDI